MAQAARLSLRMQKELKLLLSDPPPGASFPSLSPTADLCSSSSSSLTSIDAEIEGPEGTVYAGGVFKIRIQIPERYPFQPPAVTFATPIYHPNIDNGGRICLDILNLPPKGAWQPSLNVSTVITSIGLLLSEPNPDDGLMCEASREFKYNRQAFDLKARAMTDKYAKASSGMVSSSIQATQQTVEHRMTGEIVEGHEVKCKGNNCIINSSKPPAVRKKLALDSSASQCEKNSNRKTNEVTDNTNEVHSVGVSNFIKKQKLSLNSFNQPPKQSECDDQNSHVDQQVPFNSTSTMIQAVNGSELQSSEVSNYNQQETDTNSASQGNIFSTYENCKRYTGSKKLSLGFSALSKSHEIRESENLMANRKLTSEHLEKSKVKLASSSVKPEFAKQGGVEELQDHEGDNCKHFFKTRDLSISDPKPCSMAQQSGYSSEECQSSIEHRDAAQNKHQPDTPLPVIVLDSDESDQEEKSKCRRSKLSLLNKRPTLGNTKVNRALVRPRSEASS